MERLQGIAVSPGIAIGEALVLDNEGFRIPRRFLPRDAVEEELERLNRAFDAAVAEVDQVGGHVVGGLGVVHEHAARQRTVGAGRDPHERDVERMTRAQHAAERGGREGEPVLPCGVAQCGAPLGELDGRRAERVSPAPSKVTQI